MLYSLAAALIVEVQSVDMINQERLTKKRNNVFRNDNFYFSMTLGVLVWKWHLD
jgi:hypothetical protein